ncbi:MAG: c-type cytochrome [Thermoguttaceae bacterium]|nr:c-type cytochrome [Thermoguttaceae bacterium]
MTRTLVLVFLFLLFAAGPVPADGYKGPVELIPSSDSQSLYVLNRDAREIAIVSIGEQKVTRTIALPLVPNSMVLAPDGKTLYVGAGDYQGKILIVDVGAGKVSGEIPSGHTPCGLVVSPDGKTVYACLRFDTCVAQYDVSTRKEQRRFSALHEPINSVITKDGTKIYVANFLPHDPSDGADVAAEITAIDLTSGKSKNIRLPNGSSSMHGIFLSPDGKYVYTTAILARYQLPTSQLERGWMNTNGFSIIDAAKSEFVNTVLLDDVDLGAANPWPIASSPDGKRVYVGLAGTHELCIVEMDKALEKLASLPKDEAQAKATGANVSKTAENVPQDLAFLVGMKKRVRLNGKGPRSLAVVGTKVYIGMYFDDTIVVVDTKSRRTKAKEFVALGPKPVMTPERLGELHWHDATLCFQYWQSCASCHPDARTDALNWDLLNDGIGNPKNAKSMLFSMKTHPAMWHGVRETGQYVIRTGFKFILFAVRPENEYKEIEAYLSAMKPLPSPRLVNGKLSESAQRGKKLFESERLACTKCHMGEYLTDMKMHDVGSRASYDQMDNFVTPTLREVWRTSPYMHDGRYINMKDVFKEGCHGDVFGDVANLNDKELDDLVEYILSL